MVRAVPTAAARAATSRSSVKYSGSMIGAPSGSAGFNVSDPRL